MLPLNSLNRKRKKKKTECFNSSATAQQFSGITFFLVTEMLCSCRTVEAFGLLEVLHNSYISIADGF